MHLILLKMDFANIENVLNESIKHLLDNRKIMFLNTKYEITNDYLDEVLDSIDGSRDLTSIDMVVERMTQQEFVDAFNSIAKYVTEITGFKCGKYTINSKSHKNLSTMLHCYCPKLKINLYFETLYKLEPGREFMYYDITPDSSYARTHNERTLIHENIRGEHKIIEYELDISYFTMTESEKRNYVLNIIRELTSRKTYVGGAIDPRFPQREPEDESASDSEDEEKMINRIARLMSYFPHYFDQYDEHNDDIS